MSCQLRPDQMKCAHQASRHLGVLYEELNAGYGANRRDVNGILRCSCGLALRAKQMRRWVQKFGHQVQKYDSNGNYLVYEERKADGQGHVYAVINGQLKGNGNYNWNGADIRKIYKLP